MHHQPQNSMPRRPASYRRRSATSAGRVAALLVAALALVRADPMRFATRGPGTWRATRRLRGNLPMSMPFSQADSPADPSMSLPLWQGTSDAAPAKEGPTYGPTAIEPTYLPTATQPTYAPTVKEPTYSPTAVRLLQAESISPPTYAPTLPPPTYSPTVPPPTYSPTATGAPTAAASQPVPAQACLAEEECAVAALRLGMKFSPGVFPTAGCFSKKGTVYFTPGSREDMTTADLPGVQERVQCYGEAPPAPTYSPTVPQPTYSPTATDAPTAAASPSVPARACLAEEECAVAALRLGMDFFPGVFPTAGCFSKKGTVYFTPGSREDMTAADLPGVQERVQCYGEAPPAGEPTPCLTEAACDAARTAAGLEEFSSGAFPTHGCFQKKGKAYWGTGGASEEVSTEDLPGLQERLYCRRTGRRASVALSKVPMAESETNVSGGNVASLGLPLFLVAAALGALC